MPFNPDADANYKAFLNARAAMSKPDADEFTEHFVKYLCEQATATGTINTSMVTAAVSNAKTATKAAKHTY